MSDIKDRLDKLKAGREAYTVTGNDGSGIELQIEGLTFTELTELARYADKGDNAKAADYMLFRTFRKSFSEEELSDEDIRDVIGGMSGKVASEILKKVREISGLVDEEEEKKA